jgi:uncharacterized protein
MRSIVVDHNMASILAIALLFMEFVVLLWAWAKWVHRAAHPFQYYGLHLGRQNQLGFLNGLSIGLFSLLFMFAIEAGLGWLVWRSPSAQFDRILLEGLLVAVGVGIVEELIFRGWLLDELERDYSLNLSLWLDSLIYAVLHYTKPIQEAIRWLMGASLSFSETLRTLPQFPGLVLLGVLLVWAKRTASNRASTSRIWVNQSSLGLPIGIHAGLVWGYYILNVGELIEYSDRVPDWITGIDRNPLAGSVGLLALGAIALWVRRQQRQLQ